MDGMFWQEQNGWWKVALARPEVDWDEVDRRLRCLLRTVAEAKGLPVADREDVVQNVMLKLQGPDLLNRLGTADAPAHYLTTVMRNLLRDEWTRMRKAQKAVRRHAEVTGPTEDQRPDRRAEWNEQQAKARYVVNHVVSADDRKVLWWFYKDGLSVADIAQRFGITEVAALQRLHRARCRVRAELEEEE